MLCIEEAGLATYVRNSGSPFLGKLSSQRMLRAIETASLPKEAARGRMVCVEEAGLATYVGDNGSPLLVKVTARL
jgi:hypothetical protein